MLSRRLVLAALGMLPAGRLWANAASLRPVGDTADGIRQFDIGPEDDPWRILVSLPEMPAPATGYSAIVTLDGSKTAPLFRAQRDATAPDAAVAIVGITYAGASRRWRDFTALATEPVDPLPGTWVAPPGSPSGGRQAFLRMIQTQLLPALQQALPLDPTDVTLFGHSLGGLFVMHALFARPALFRRYAVADPSTWWNAGATVDEAIAFAGGVQAAGGRMEPRTLLFMRAKSLSQGGRIGPRLLDPDLRAALQDINGLDLIYRLYPEESHGSILAPSVGHTLRLHLGQRPG